jgi:transcriptional regulator with XRE-family HTH domain
MSKLSSDFDEHIVFARRLELRHYGWTGRKIAVALGLSPEAISNIMAGRRKSPAVRMAICNITGLDHVSLWGETKPELEGWQEKRFKTLMKTVNKNRKSISK